MTTVTARDEDADINAPPGGWAQLRFSDSTCRSAATQIVCRPDRPSRLLSAMPAPEGRSLIARGSGQGLGDAALNDGGAVALTVRLDRMLSFDPDEHMLVAEAGVTIGDILRTFLPRRHMPAVYPGSLGATLGGAIAADAHGTNHMRAGSFGDHVIWLDLITPRGGLRRVSPQEEPALFAATIGGMGLTGLIARAAIRMAPITSTDVTLRRQAIGSLDMLLDQLTAGAQAHAYAAAWIDMRAPGTAQERGVLETADIASGGGRAWSPARHRSRPSGGLADMLLPPRLALRVRSERQYRRARHGRTSTMAIDRFLRQHGVAPASRLAQHGTVRLHCVLPRDGVAAAIRRLLDIARRAGGAAGAAVQAIGKDGRGMLSFARTGIALVLDLPISVVEANLMHRLERETLDRGGRVFLASDAHLTDHGFAAMYPRLAEFRAVLADIDPDMRLQSDLARRLRLRDYIV
ncbi:FAD-binding oxidoreductase [Vineibacter terrae]|uniref:FAD-binding oxidoreductase n=1 Tax=Vineibacter terrae TaxID=2586908 RepID=A0A5C8PLF3_9HYPH|nr:FAD-binding oxidoreductase [Vineibacter terrae]TXL74849.1 FAD-binding oxidoreductase [Vineibacter terrae]